MTKNPIRNAALFSIINAVIVETLFLVIKQIFGASGVAAHPNLLIDLIITMPWYILLARSFVKIQNRQRFSKTKVLLPGGLYEIGADGFAGPFFGSLWGNYLILSPFYWILIITISFWQFIER